MKQIVTLMLVVFSVGVFADKIHDPTQPKFKLPAGNVPTQVPTLEELEKGKVHLQGVMNKKGNKVAIIAGKLYNKGDSVNGYLIGEINNDHVVLLKAGVKKRLYVYE